MGLSRDFCGVEGGSEMLSDLKRCFEGLDGEVWRLKLRGGIVNVSECECACE